MKKALLIQFRSKWELVESERTSFQKNAGAHYAPFSFISALDEKINWSEPEKVLDGHTVVVLGGSGEFDFDGGRAFDDIQRKVSHEMLDRMRPFLQYLFDYNIPTIGICFGHQMIGAFKGVSVVHDSAQKKVGTYDVSIISEHRQDPIFKHVPNTFSAQYGHKDSLSALPEGATLIVNGTDCKFSGLKYSDVIYTFQFHPEMDAEDVALRLKNSPGYLPEGVAAEDIVHPSPHATRMLANFFHVVA